MHHSASDRSEEHERSLGSDDRRFSVSEDVRAYILERGCDFRVCTSCGGPILLPVTVKRPKTTDFQVKVGPRTLYISRYQASFATLIDGSMIPRSLRRWRE